MSSLPKPMADVIAEMLDVAVLKNRGMMVLATANVIGMFGFFVPIIFSSSRALSLGVSDNNAALLLSIIGEHLSTLCYRWLLQRVVWTLGLLVQFVT